MWSIIVLRISFLLSLGFALYLFAALLSQLAKRICRARTSADPPNFRTKSNVLTQRSVISTSKMDYSTVAVFPGERSLRDWTSSREMGKNCYRRVHIRRVEGCIDPILQVAQSTEHGEDESDRLYWTSRHERKKLRIFW
jgi:hypothetical protein